MATNTPRSKTATLEAEIVKRVDRLHPEAVDFLEQIVNVNSGTMNHEGVRQVGLVFSRRLEQLGFQCRWEPMEQVNRAGHLFAEHGGDRGRRLLLVGHIDTVFEADSRFQVFRRHGNRAVGPGVVDMKGGDVVMLFALRALHEAGALDRCRVTVALMGDEEDTGAPLTLARRPLWEAADRSDIGLGFEMSGPTPATATLARRGATGWQLKTSGRAGHSSRVFHPDFGSGAIYEIARVLYEFHREFTDEANLTLSPGVLLGGTRVDLSHEVSGAAYGKHNVIPKLAVATGDLRFISTAQRKRAKQRMRAIVGRHLAHCGGSIHFKDAYPAMSPTAGNYNLLDELDRISHRLGAGRVHPLDPAERGAADISFVAGRVEACLDGLGPAGWGDHTHDETVDLATLPLQIKKAALLILRLTRGRTPRSG